MRTETDYPKAPRKRSPVQGAAIHLHGRQAVGWDSEVTPDSPGTLRSCAAARRRSIFSRFPRLEELCACLLLVLTVLQVTSELPLRVALMAFSWLSGGTQP